MKPGFLAAVVVCPRGSSRGAEVRPLLAPATVRPAGPGGGWAVTQERRANPCEGRGNPALHDAPLGR
jgi:hypothetical protein